MQLEISDHKNLLDRAFIEWLKIKIRDKIIADIDPKKLENWDNFFNNQSMYKSIYKKKISAIDLISAGASNLDYRISDSKFQILLNPNIYASGLDRIKVDTICRLINYGNRDLAGYPIFTDTFNYFAENIDLYVSRYLYGML